MKFSTLVSFGALLLGGASPAEAAPFPMPFRPERFVNKTPWTAKGAAATPDVCQVAHHLKPAKCRQFDIPAGVKGYEHPYNPRAEIEIFTFPDRTYYVSLAEGRIGSEQERKKGIWTWIPQGRTAVCVPGNYGSPNCVLYKEK